MMTAPTYMAWVCIAGRRWAYIHHAFRRCAMHYMARWRWAYIYNAKRAALCEGV